MMWALEGGDQVMKDEATVGQDPQEQKNFHL